MNKEMIVSTNGHETMVALLEDDLVEQAERAIEAMRTKAREGRLDLPTGRKVHRSFADALTSMRPPA